MRIYHINHVITLFYVNDLTNQKGESINLTRLVQQQKMFLLFS